MRGALARGPHRQSLGRGGEQSFGDHFGLFSLRERLLEPLHAIGKHPRCLEPLEKIRAGRKLDPIIAKLFHFAGQLVEREVTMHERVERNFHG